MRHGISAGAALVALLLTACGPAQVVVTAEIQVEDPLTGESTARSLSDLEVRILPYDRDVVFDSLTRVAMNPEPPIPEEVLEAQNQVAQAQNVWREAENSWNMLRDTLQKLNDALGQYSRGEQRYIQLYNEFQSLDGQLGGVERQMEGAFQRFDSLSKANISAAEAVRIQRDNWADEAFVDFPVIAEALTSASGLDVAADTTNAAGVATFEVKPGTYWVTTRYEEPYTELYWNVPLEVARGEPAQLRLTRQNAQERPKL